MRGCSSPTLLTRRSVTAAALTLPFIGRGRAATPKPVVATFGAMDLAYLPNIIAVEQGIAAANGLDLKLRITEGGPQSRTMVAAEEAQFQHGDTTLVVDHAVPSCVSREIFRAVVDDRAHSVFQGRIIVRPDAQKTDGKMMTRALLLSDEAEADNKPELEIFADDVTCGHGATSGALDESLLFYLRARGLPEKDAQALLIQAFVGEAIEGIANDDLRDAVTATAQRWLEARS